MTPARPQSDTENDPRVLSFESPLPSVEAGFGVLQNTCGWGRMGASINFFGGLNQIAYWGTIPDAAPPVFFTGDGTSSYVRLFRAQVVIEGAPYNLEFSRTAHYPFGYRSHFAASELGVEVAHRLTLVNDALVFSIEVLRNNRSLKLRQRFEHHGYTKKFGGEHLQRTFSNWEEIPQGWRMDVHDSVAEARWEQQLAEVKKGGVIQMHFHNNAGQLKKLKSEAQKSARVTYPVVGIGVREATTAVGLIGDLGLSLRETLSGRFYFTGGEFTEGSHACALLFAPAGDAFEARAAELCGELPSVGAESEAAFNRRIGESPRLALGRPVMESLLANIPLSAESLILEDVPGAARAATTHYGVWGWDTMMCSDAYLVSGRRDFVRGALDFYRKSADPVHGVGHMFTKDLHVRIPQAPAAQGLYLIMLYKYGSHTGDLDAWSEYYPFAKEVFDRIRRSINDQGLGLGSSLFPDFPQYAGHNGDDISVFNNSILYQAVRGMEAMAGAAGDTETGEEARRLARQIETHFVKTFWDTERQYFADSVDSETGEQRPSYPLYALLWETPFLEDLAGETLAACGNFQAQHHLSLHAFLIYPRWDMAFDGEGNQNAQTWSNCDAFAMRCQAAAGRQDVFAKWIEGCEWFWKTLTIPEGYSAQTVNDSGTPDLPGGKQPFGGKSVFMAFLTGAAGLHFDAGGLTIEEGREERIEVERIAFRGATLSVSVEGAGKFLRSLTVNGTPIAGSRKIPLAMIKGDVRIVCERTGKAPEHPVLLSLFGAEVLTVAAEGSGMKAEVSGRGHAWVRFYAQKKPRVLLNDLEVQYAYDPGTLEGKALLLLDYGASVRLEILQEGDGSNPK